jgi:hypothetical protein
MGVMGVIGVCGVCGTLFLPRLRGCLAPAAEPSLTAAAFGSAPRFRGLTLFDLGPPRPDCASAESPAANPPGAASGVGLRFSSAAGAWSSGKCGNGAQSPTASPHCSLSLRSSGMSPPSSRSRSSTSSPSPSAWLSFRYLPCVRNRAHWQGGKGGSDILETNTGGGVDSTTAQRDAA